MYEAAFKNIDDTLWKDAGCSSELDYIEPHAWSSRIERIKFEKVAFADY